MKLKRPSLHINHDDLRQGQRWLDKIMTEPERAALLARVNDLFSALPDTRRDMVIDLAWRCAAVGAVVAVRETRAQREARGQ